MLAADDDTRRTGAEREPQAAALRVAPRQPSAQLIRVPEAARLTGLPQSLMRKSFMREEKRPRNVPAPPPHIHIGRAVYIFADKLPGWVASLGIAMVTTAPAKRRGRPTVAERIARRESEAA